AGTASGGPSIGAIQRGHPSGPSIGAIQRGHPTGTAIGAIQRGHPTGTAIGDSHRRTAIGGLPSADFQRRTSSGDSQPGHPPGAIQRGPSTKDAHHRLTPATPWFTCHLQFPAYDCVISQPPAALSPTHGVSTPAATRHHAPTQHITVPQSTASPSTPGGDRGRIRTHGTRRSAGR
ncbi:MAG: hypothetical protein RIT02_731, partial [Planctomycetota bacterium]